MTTQFTNPVHLYRSLLRETTYLVDPYARTIIKKYIVQSFRSKSAALTDKHTACPTFTAGRLPGLHERRQLSRGRKFLSTLQRANQGYELPLTNVIKLAYGRKGRSRRELMSSIMARADDGAVTHHQKSNTANGTPLIIRSKKFAEGWEPPSKFTELLRSQMRVQPVLDSSRKLKSQAEIPDKNKKGQPMPRSRIRNLKKAWYAKSAAALFPYLEEKDWSELKARCEGRGFIIPKRRPIANVAIFTKDDDEGACPQSHLLKGPVKPRSRRQRITMGNPHRLSNRYLRRSYVRAALRCTPRAVVLPEGKGLSLQWDDGQQRLPSARAPVNGEQADLLFR